MNAALPLPLDVRLMNATASLALAGLALGCVTAAISWVLHNPVFAIRQIVVTGDTAHHSAASLRASVLPRLGGNFFSIDLDAAQQAFQALHWVRTAVVQREFPGRINVQLQEHVAAARWGEGDAHLVDASGEVFEVTSGDAEDAALPRLNGPQGQSAAVLAMYRQLEPLVAPLGMRMVALDMGARGDWRAELDRGAVVQLGHGAESELAGRLSRFAATAREVAARHQRDVTAIETADLRHPGGYALRLRGITTVRPAHAEPALPGRPAPTARPAAAAPARR